MYPALVPREYCNPVDGWMDGWMKRARPLCATDRGIAAGGRLNSSGVVERVEARVGEERDSA